MYKLLIVDDEPLVQVGIKSMLDWASMDIEVCGTASNGDMALKMIENQMPDIVITDIKMPILSGLELLKACREKYGNLPAFIILTSYEDFNMAKQAITYQVTDYLVKLELNADMLKESIQKAIQTVLKHNDAQPRVSEQMPASAAFLQERFFLRLVNNLIENEDEFRTQSKELSIELSGYGHIAGYFQISSPNEQNMDSRQLLKLYDSTLQMFIRLMSKYITCYVTPLDMRHFMIIFPLTDDSPKQNYKRISNAVTSTCKMLKNYYNSSIRGGIGSPVNNPFEMSDSFFKAKKALLHTDETNAFCFYDELPSEIDEKADYDMNDFKEENRHYMVTNIKHYIDQNLDQKLTLNEVAAAFGISPSYLSSLFGKYSDMGFVTYVNTAKINAAKIMLHNSNDKIYEIAEKLGFESAFYFSKVFKKVEGVSPREYLSKL